MKSERLKEIQQGSLHPFHMQNLRQFIGFYGTICSGEQNYATSRQFMDFAPIYLELWLVILHSFRPVLPFPGPFLHSPFCKEAYFISQFLYTLFYYRPTPSCIQVLLYMYIRTSFSAKNSHILCVNNSPSLGKSFG